MTMTTSSSSLNHSDLRASLDLVEIKPGTKFSMKVLKDLLPDAETALFFGKVYDLDYVQLSRLLKTVLNSDLATELFAGTHSTSLQSYILQPGWLPDYTEGFKIQFANDGEADVPKGEILPHLWEQLEVEVAQSIKDVASKLESVVGLMPGKQGNMIFKAMRKMNRRRPIIGDYRATIDHGRVRENLLILDVSGSMTAPTIKAIVEDVVALSYKANAHMAIVSNTATHWDPGAYSVKDVLREAEFGGTQYEQLVPLLTRQWGTVITVADYDSSWSAFEGIKDQCLGIGEIDQVLDISLVNRPTYLSECVGQLAKEVRPLLVADDRYSYSVMQA